jgi:hypothetical protein
MNISHSLFRRAAALSAAAALAAGGASALAADHSMDASPAATTRSAVALHDGMRKLWEDHITWTRLAIVSFAAGDKDLQATETRLLRNQTDIGNAIKPYYGAKAGRALTALLKEHITGAVALLVAAKSGDNAALAKAKTAWYANGNQIADFLAKANPHSWPRKTMRSMMKEHLDVTLKEAVDELTGKYSASVRDYESIHHHILAMADGLSNGIIRQFPSRFPR